jgi:transposase-like protein
MNQTNAIESLNMQLRKIIKTRGHFPNDESAIKSDGIAVSLVCPRVMMVRVRG